MESSNVPPLVSIQSNANPTVENNLSPKTIENSSNDCNNNNLMTDHTSKLPTVEEAMQETTAIVKPLSPGVIANEENANSNIEKIANNSVAIYKSKTRNMLNVASPVNYVDCSSSDNSDDEDLDVDNHIFCDDCGEFRMGECSRHGPYIYVQDTQVEMDAKDRAKLTVPDGITIGKTLKDKKFLSAWTVKSFSKNTVFGPYEGRERSLSRRKNLHTVFDGGLIWEIYSKGEVTHYIDAANVRKSNWMRYISCANDLEDHNLIAYQYQGKIYYRLCKDVGSGEKLLIQQKDEFTEHLGIPAKFEDEVQDAQYECTTCKEVFQNEDTLSDHMKSKHIRKIPKTLHCKQCNYTCMQAITLANHQLTHSTDKRFQCKFCDKLFTKKNELKEHVTTHSQNDAPADKFKCDLCDKGFRLRVKLKKHIKTVHEVLNTFNCHLCFSDFIRESDLKEHLKSHSDEFPLELKCEFCEMTFSATATYKSHLKSHAEHKNNRFPCDVCKKRFSSSYRLKKHTKNVHETATNECAVCDFSSFTTFDLTTHEKTHEGAILKCKSCDNEFPELDRLKAHTKSVHTEIRVFKCLQCSYQSVRSGDVQRHSYVHNKERAFKCDVCGKQFGRKYSLNNHMGIHMDEKKYKCEICGKSFMAEYRLRRHIQNVHETVKSYACKECGDTFDERSKLTEHTKLHPIKTYMCVICGKSVSGKYQLNTHLKLHNSENLHKCDQCEKCFHTKGVLKKHIENVHLKIKRHCCEVCKAFFSQKGQLTAHFRTHTGERPYLCKYCGKSFSVSSHLRQHERIHTGETPYKCSYCEKGFRRYHHLRQHEMWHTGEKPHQCQYCEKHFAVRGNMLQHERTHTGERPFKCRHCKKGFGHHSVMRTHEKTHEKELALSYVSPPPPPVTNHNSLLPVSSHPPAPMPHYVPSQHPGLPPGVPYLPPGTRMESEESYSMILNCMNL